MNIIICGAGKVGFSISKQLSAMCWVGIVRFEWTIGSKWSSRYILNSRRAGWVVFGASLKLLEYYLQQYSTFYNYKWVRREKAKYSGKLSTNKRRESVFLPNIFAIYNIFYVLKILSFRLKPSGWRVLSTLIGRELAREFCLFPTCLIVAKSSD